MPKSARDKDADAVILSMQNRMHDIANRLTLVETRCDRLSSLVKSLRQCVNTQTDIFNQP